MKSLELRCLTGDFTHLVLAWIRSAELRAELYAFENPLPSQQFDCLWVCITAIIDKQKESSERRKKTPKTELLWVIEDLRRYEEL